MPFAVSQWPYSPDPRTAQFDQTGWDFGQVPPWSWIISTTAATGPFDIFNSGVVVKPFAALATETLFRQVDVLPEDITVRLSSQGFIVPFGMPPGITKTLKITIAQPEFTEAEGQIDLTFPTAIAVQGPIVMTVLPPPIGTIPNPMVLTPAKWDV